MDLKREEIRRQVADLAARYAGRRSGAAGGRSSAEFLTGEKWGLSARDLVYLCFDVERVFQIEISGRDLEKYQFATIDGIVETVCGKK